MATFRDIWNIIIDADTKGVKQGVKDAGDAVEGTFKGRISNALQAFGLNAQQSGALIGTAVTAGATAAGAAIVGFAEKSIGEFQKQAQEVLHFKEVTGLAATEASKFVAVADDYGVSAQDLSTEIGRLNKVAEASPEKLAGLGIEIAKNKDGAYDAQQTFLNVVDAFNSTDDASKRAAIGSAAFGKNWQSMVNLLDQGSQKLRTSFAQVSKYQLFTDEDLAKSEKYRHALDDLNDAVHGFERELGQALVPLVTKAVGELKDLAEGADKVTKPIGGVSGVLEKVGEGLGLVISGLRHLMDPIQMYTDVTNGFKAAWHGIFGGGGDDTDKLARGFENIDEQASKTTESILRDAAAVARHKEEMDKAAESARIYMESNQGLRDSLDEQRFSAEKATKALSDYRVAQHDLINDQLGLEGAFNRATDAIAAFTEKTLDHTTKTNDLRDANLNARKSFADLADQAVITAQKQADLTGATLTAQGAVDAQVSALSKLFSSLASDSPLRKALDEYILALYNIPGQIVTNVDLTGNGLDVLGRSTIGSRREGSGAQGYSTPAEVVGAVKAYESSNGTSWRTGPQ